MEGGGGGGKQITFKERSESEKKNYLFWPNSIIVLMWLISTPKWHIFEDSKE